jgi:ABC-2 family transporter protein
MSTRPMMMMNDRIDREEDEDEYNEEEEEEEVGRNVVAREEQEVDVGLKRQEGGAAAGGLRLKDDDDDMFLTKNETMLNTNNNNNNNNNSAILREEENGEGPHDHDDHGSSHLYRDNFGEQEEENPQEPDHEHHGDGGGGGENGSASAEMSNVKDVVAAAAAATAAPNAKNKQPEGEGEDSFYFRLCLGGRQFAALLHKNALIKLRTPIATSMEILSPVFIMLVLVLAYNLSETSNVPGQTYSVLEFSAPGPWIDLLSSSVVPFMMMAKPTPQAGNITKGSNSSLLLQQQQTPRQRKLQHLFSAALYDGDNQDNLDATSNINKMLLQKQQLWSPEWLFNLVQHPGPSPVINPTSSSSSSSIRRLQEGEDSDNGADVHVGKTDDEMDIFEVLADGLKFVRRTLSSPIVIPTLPQYLQLHAALSSLINVNDDIPIVLQESQYLRDWGNLLLLGTLHLSPSNSSAARAFEAYIMMTNTTATSSSSTTNSTSSSSSSVMNSTLQIHWHDSEAVAVQYINDNIRERTWALIDFAHWPEHDLTSDSSAALHVKYKIRMNQTVLPDTDEIINYVTTGLDRTYQRYYLSGYLTLQRTLNDFAFDYFVNTTATTMCGEDRPKNIWSMPMPTAMYTQNDFFLQVGYLLGLTMVMAFLFPVSRLIKTIVEEKELRLRETLYILGVEPWAHFGSSLTMAGIMFVVTAILVTTILSKNVLKYSNAMLLFAWIVLFLTATLGFCFSIAALFSKSKLASIVGPMAFFATILRT